MVQITVAVIVLGLAGSVVGAPTAKRQGLVCPPGQEDCNGPFPPLNGTFSNSKRQNLETECEEVDGVFLESPEADDEPAEFAPAPPESKRQDEEEDFEEVESGEFAVEDGSDSELNAPVPAPPEVKRQDDDEAADLEDGADLDSEPDMLAPAPPEVKRQDDVEDFEGPVQDEPDLEDDFDDEGDLPAPSTTDSDGELPDEEEVDDLEETDLLVEEGDDLGDFPVLREA